MRSLVLALAAVILAPIHPTYAQLFPGAISAPQSGSGVAGCAQATTFLARTSGLSAGLQTEYTRYICGLVTDGVISGAASMASTGGTPYCGTKLDALWWTATADPATANLDLCGHTAYTLVPNGDASFVANFGYMGVDGGGSGAEVWSATHLNGNLAGGGTTTLTYTGSGGIEATGYASFGSSNWKQYWEAAIIAANLSDLTDGQIGLGIGNIAGSVADYRYLGQGTDSLGLYFINSGTGAVLWINSSASVSYNLGFTIANSDSFGFALDLVNKRFWWRDVTQHSGWFGSAPGGDPSTNTNGFSLNQPGFTILSNPVAPVVTLKTNGDAVYVAFTAATVTDPAPTGFGAFSSVSYLDTSLNPATAGGNYVQNCGHLSAWSLTNASSGSLGGVIIGLNSGGSGDQSNIVARYQDGKSYGAVNTNLGLGNANVAVADSLHDYIISRNASNLQTLYKNGSSIATDANASSALTSLPIFLLARNSPTGAEYGSGLRVAEASVGGCLSSGNVTALHTRGCTFLTAVSGSC